LPEKQTDQSVLQQPGEKHGNEPVPTRGQPGSGSNRKANVDHDPEIINPQKVPGVVVRRGYDERLISL